MIRNTLICLLFKEPPRGHTFNYITHFRRIWGKKTVTERKIEGKGFYK